jgi:hypothetical protein
MEISAEIFFNPLNAELNSICHLLALSGAHHILHVSRIRVKPEMASQKTSENHAFGKKIRQETCINEIKYFFLTDGPSYLSAKLKFFKFDFRKSVNHHTIQINQPTRCNSFTSLLLDVYVWLYMFRTLRRPSSGAYNCTRSLWFYRWSVVVGAFLVVVCQTTTNNAPAAFLQR